MKIICLIILFTFHTFAGTKVVVISDLNGSYGSKTYHPAIRKSIDQIATISPDIVISTGDMVAGQKAGLDYKGMWLAFHERVTIPLAQIGIPFAVTPGNHDGSGALSFKLERSEFIYQWKQYAPRVQYVEDSHYPVYYAFVQKDILFVSLDATLVGKLSQAQKDWLALTLKKNDHYPHKVLFGHLPIFPVTQQKTNEFIDDPGLMKMMKDHNVSLFLSGHHHAYYPGIYDGIRQISQGCLGSGPRKILGSEHVSSRSMTVIEFTDDGKILVDALGGDNIDKIIERKTLPRQIHYKNRKMHRDDLSF